MGGVRYTLVEKHTHVVSVRTPTHTWHHKLQHVGGVDGRIRRSEGAPQQRKREVRCHFLNHKQRAYSARAPCVCTRARV